jgi:hypothetical protein
MATFRDLDFGSASARTEREIAPHLLLEGYYDLDNHMHRLLRGPQFVVLGYKGSGKSAVGERLALLQDVRKNLYVRQMDLEEFPFGSLEKIIGGALDAQSKYPIAWSWLILLTLLDSFLTDHQLVSTSDADLDRVVRILRQVGLLPAMQIRDLALTSLKGSVKAGVPTLLEAGVEWSSEGRDPWPQVASLLKRLVLGLRTPSRHILVIDGLDTVLTRDDVPLASLSALLNELVRLNAEFTREKTPTKVLLLCRADLYNRLPNPNKNAIRRDKGISLDWYQDVLDPQETHLIKLIGRRAEISGYTGDDVLGDYLPPEINRRPAKAYLLDHTRHTPRDLIAALKDIQRFSDTGRLAQEQVHKGLRQYAVDYFYNEIHDELTGLLEDEERVKALQLLASLRQRQFPIAKLRSKARGNRSWADLDIDRVAGALFECSAIGNVQHSKGAHARFIFRYRNWNAALDVDDDILLHRALWNALDRSSRLHSRENQSQDHRHEE